MQSSQFKISGILQPFLVPKPHNRLRPILDLSKPNPLETIRTTLQQGEWVTSIDFKDAYLHIPIQEQSRKYLRFHVQGQTYQFKALPFGMSTAPSEFTVVAKEVKLMAIHKGIRIHQYLDDWLVRARSHQVCLQYTQDLVKICQELGWLVNLEKPALEPKQIFVFVSYQFYLRTASKQKKKNKKNGRVPESLEKVIPISWSLYLHLQWWLSEDNVLTGQPLHPIEHAPADFY